MCNNYGLFLVLLEMSVESKFSPIAYKSLITVFFRHLKRIWEIEYPEEAEISLDRL